jgi:hypothetical protein
MVVCRAGTLQRIERTPPEAIDQSAKNLALIPTRRDQ